MKGSTQISASSYFLKWHPGHLHSILSPAPEADLPDDFSY